MPATDKVSHRITKEAEKLTNQWLAYVAKERLIKKVFVSIKGVYYQANVKGQEVRWLVPFKFPTNIPTDVDFRIMLTFLEFYSTLLHFVLFRLYNDANLIYPPTIDTEKLKGIGGLSSYVLQSKDQGVKALLPNAKKAADSKDESKKVKETKLSKEEISKAVAADKSLNENAEDNVSENVEDVELDEFSSTNKTTGDLLSQPSKFASPTSTLLSKFIFYVGREVPLDILEFCILSCGGSIISEIALDELQLNQHEEYKKLDLSNITHQIVDRPKVASKVAGRTYVQPQWVFDCLNKSELLPVSQYAPGETLPPHLSPWGDAGGYNPDAEVKPTEEGEEEEEEEEEIEGDEVEEDIDEEYEEEEDEDLQAQKELELEAAGVKSADAQKDKKDKKSSKGKKRSAEDEEKDLKKIMMSNKQRKLYKKMQYGIDKKEARQDDLTKKRKKLEKTKAELGKLNKKN